MVKRTRNYWLRCYMAMVLFFVIFGLAFCMGVFLICAGAIVDSTAWQFIGVGTVMVSGAGVHFSLGILD